MEIVRQVNMALDRDRYISRCKETSEVLVEHVIKLMIFRSPNDVRGWKNSVAKGFKCETVSFTGMKHKPRKFHLSEVTNSGNQINLDALISRINFIKDDPDYKNLQVRNISPLAIRSALNDLVYGLDETKVYTKEEISDYIDKWYKEESQLYNLN